MNCLSIAVVLVLSAAQEPVVPGQGRLDGVIQLPADPEEPKAPRKALLDVFAAARDDLAKLAVQQVLDDQVAAWNKGDLEGFMAGYWKSDDLTFFSGNDVTRGWKATLERYRKRYQADGKEMGKLTFSELKIEMLGEESALVRGRWKVVTSKETLQGLFTVIFKKTSDGWKIVHDHTSAG
jgi:beta-aspartyl-peptidase (threonine type)